MASKRGALSVPQAFQLSLSKAHKSLGLIVLSLAYALCHIGDSMGHRGYRYGGHLHDLLTCFRQDGADLRETIEAQSGQVLYCICYATPAPNHDWEGRESGSQPFTEIARLGKAPRKH